MKLAISTIAGEVSSADVPSEMELENLIPLIQADCPSVASLPVSQLVLVRDGREINVATQLKQTLNAIGLKDGDVLVLMVKTQHPVRRPAPAPTGSGLGIDFSAIKIPKAGQSTTARTPTSNGATSSGACEFTRDFSVVVSSNYSASSNRRETNIGR